MKMSKETFSRLEKWIDAWLKYNKLDREQVQTSGDAWLVLRFVADQVSYDDSHPMYDVSNENHFDRILPPELANVRSEGNGGSGTGLFAFLYYKEGLNDDHIKTALRKIFPHIEGLK